MKVAVIGSRGINIDIEEYLADIPISLIISGGARGIDKLAEKYADKMGIVKLIFLRDYGRYKRGAPLIRNKLIIDSADLIVAFWDRKSNGTRFSIDYAQKQGKHIKIYFT